MTSRFAAFDGGPEPADGGVPMASTMHAPILDSTALAPPPGPAAPAPRGTTTPAPPDTTATSREGAAEPETIDTASVEESLAATPEDGGLEAIEPALRRRRAVLIPAIASAVTDLLVIVGSMLLTYALSGGAKAWDGSAALGGDHSLALTLVAAIWMVALAGLGTYSSKNRGAKTMEYRRVVFASVAAAALSGLGFYLTRTPFSRAFFAILFAIGMVLLLAGRFVVRQVLHRMHRRGLLGRTVLLGGTPARIDELSRVLKRENWLGYKVVGGLTPKAPRGDHSPGGVPLVGETADTLDAVESSGADAVIFADGSFPSSKEFRRMSWDMEGNDEIEMMMAPSVTDIAEERIDVRPVGGLPLVHISGPAHRTKRLVLKRAFDIVVSSILLVIFAIPMAVLAVLIKREDGGDVLFRQRRVGQRGEHFTCLKFRSMVPDAEARLAQLKADQSDGVLFKMADDPRITKIGKLIRRYSLDELPQLWNVLRGDMSLVGPRPPLPKEVEQYGDDVHRRLAARPGMTGLWQVSGRSNLSWEETVRLDIYYVDNWSMLQDLSILTRTIKAVIGSDGAY